MKYAVIEFENNTDTNQLAKMVKKAFGLDDTTQENYETAFDATTYIGESNTIEARLYMEYGEVTLRVSSIGYVTEEGDAVYLDITKEFRKGFKALKETAPKGWKLTVRN